ncbi:MAG: Ribonuclease [Verrucomicrobiales bacterium]|nr:Ribonuclease [Verrucomicrobiales bacterium]
MATPVKIPRRFRFEHELFAQGISPIAGVDEAGRGPLAGPVVAGAVILPEAWYWSGMPNKLKKVNDSKQLTPEEREELFAQLTQNPLVLFSTGIVDVQVIDQINILQATHRAMNLALSGLSVSPVHVLVDGLEVKSLSKPQTALVQGDGRSYSIGAASIIAKVTRDRLMRQFHDLYPHYGFHEHKGYGTPEHLLAIKTHGPCAIHRMTFAPMRPVQTEFGDMLHVIEQH